MASTRHRTPFAPLFGLGLVLALGLTGCGGDDDAADGGDPGGDGADGSDDGSDGDGSDDGSPDADAAVGDCSPVKGTNLALERVASGFDEPVFVTSPPGDTRLFVVSKHGTISIVKGGKVLPTPFLDIDGRVDSSPEPNEQGLLGLAFHPDYADNGRFFVFFTEDVEGEDAPDVVAEFRVMDGNPDVADPSSEREILTVPDSQPNHNGGMLAFGREDGYLYIGMGDGGSSDDPGGNGQDLSSLLGDMLRLDVSSTDEPYRIPADNPYVGKKGDPTPRGEIYISGLRNPWRWSFDRENGDMYLADVGQNSQEEVNVLPVGQQSGANLGWSAMEGMNCRQAPCDAFNAPEATYQNDGGEAVVGGYVYRGTCFPDIQGWYFYGDYGSERVFKFVYAGGAASEQQEVTKDIDPDSVLDGLSSFGQDAVGELYAVSLRTGEVFHIVAGP